MTEAALLAAIVAHPEEDTPRLAYADYLDEHGDPDRAGFIRVQCRLAAGTPADPEYPELRARGTELLFRLNPRWAELAPALAEPLRFQPQLPQWAEGIFRRGFPYVAQWPTADGGPDRLRPALEAAVATTTVRGLRLVGATPDQAGEVLQFPAAADLDVLLASPTAPGPQDGVAEAVAFSPACVDLRQLGFDFGLGEAGTDALAEAPFGRLADLSVQGLYSVPAAGRLCDAGWFGRLRRVHLTGGHPPAVEAAVAGLARAPGLHSLELPNPQPTIPAVLARAAGFPALARLDLPHRPLTAGEVGLLAGAAFPRLSSLDLSGVALGDEGLAAIARAGWFAGLRELAVESNNLTDTGIAALAASPCAAHLRTLRIGGNPFELAGLTAISVQNTFPNLIVLDLRADFRSRVTPADMVRFLEGFWARPVRHLNLEGWRIGDAGAKAVAGNPAFATLTRLGLARCGLSDVGASALFGSPHLQRLVAIDLAGNAVRDALLDLADPAVMPQLGVCRVNDTSLTPAVQERLAAARSGLFPPPRGRP